MTAAAAVALSGVGVFAGPSASADLTPTTATITLAPGESGTENKTVTIPALPQNADIVVAIDTTGSMTPAINQAKADASSLVGAVQASIPSANFAVVQFRDYGDSPEYAVVQANTNSVVAVQGAINTLTAGGGADLPEAHNLVFQNAAIEGLPLWRANTKRFLVVITDATPHSPSFPACEASPYITPDPHGLDTPTQIAALVDDQTTLFALTTNTGFEDPAACFADIAANAYPGSVQASLGADLSAQVVSLIEAASATVNDIHLEVASASAGADASWITFDPASVGPVSTPAEANFVLTATVPDGTPAGTYVFDIVALADGGDVGHQELTIEVEDACPNQVNTFDQPINADGSSNFKQGSTIPVKVRITCDGVPLAGVSPDVDLVRIDSSPEGPVNEVVSSSAADDGDNMRVADGKYMFNLSTKRSQFNAGADLVQGTYRLTVDDSDSPDPAFDPFSVTFDLRK